MHSNDFIWTRLHASFFFFITKIPQNVCRCEIIFVWQKTHQINLVYVSVLNANIQFTIFICIESSTYGNNSMHEPHLFTLNSFQVRINHRWKCTTMKDASMNQGCVPVNANWQFSVRYGTMQIPLQVAVPVQNHICVPVQELEPVLWKKNGRVLQKVL